MSIKTPEQIAGEIESNIYSDDDNYLLTREEMREHLIAAIEADRAQRAEIHQDWRDDQDMVRDADHVDVTWTAHAVDGREYFRSDMTLTAAQAVGMFQGIGEA